MADVAKIINAASCARSIHLLKTWNLLDLKFKRLNGLLVYSTVIILEPDQILNIIIFRFPAISCHFLPDQPSMNINQRMKDDHL